MGVQFKLLDALYDRGEYEMMDLAVSVQHAPLLTAMLMRRLWHSRRNLQDRLLAAEVACRGYQHRAEVAERERDKAVAALDRVRLVHQPVTGPYWGDLLACKGCSIAFTATPYPCPTIRAIDGDAINASTSTEGE